MKKSLVSLLLVGALVAPSALVFAEETTTDPGTNPSGVSQQDFKNGDYYSHTVFDQIDEAEVEDVETDTLPLGKKVVKTEAVNGIYKYDVYKRYVDGEHTDTVNGDWVYTTDRVDGVTLVGTGILENHIKEYRVYQDYETIIEYSDELDLGTEEISDGVRGFTEYKETWQTLDGEIIEGSLEKVVTKEEAPINAVLTRGTKEVADEFKVNATLVDEEGNALDGEVLTITGEDVEQELTTDKNGAVTFSVPNGTYTVAFGINSETVVVEDEDISVELVAGAVDKDPEPEFYIGVVRNDFPQFDAEGNEYEVVIGEEVTTITITDKDGKLVATIEYNEDTQTTKIKYIPATPIQPGVNTKDIVDGVKEKFPTFDNKDYTYETKVTETKVIVTIKNKEGNLVAVVEYDREKEAYSVKPAELTPAEPIEKDEETTEEETTEEEDTDKEESTVEESEVVDVVTADGQPVRVVRTDSRSELPETGELGGTTAMMAAALSALGGLGLLFKKRK